MVVYSVLIGVFVVLQRPILMVELFFGYGGDFVKFDRERKVL